MSTADTLRLNLKVLRITEDPEIVAWWARELRLLLKGYEIDPDTLDAAFRSYRAEMQAARDSGKFVGAPIPEAIIGHYWSCYRPPPVEDCGRCSGGMVIVVRDGYDVAVPCECPAGQRRLEQRRR